MSGFEVPFHNDEVFPENHALHNMPVSRKASNKRANKLVSDGTPFH